MHFRAHYNVFMKAIEVDNEVLNLPTDVFDTDLRKGTIIDSGTTLAYFPDVIYEPLISKVHYKNIRYCLLFIVSYQKNNFRSLCLRTEKVFSLPDFCEAEYTKAAYC